MQVRRYTVCCTLGGVLADGTLAKQTLAGMRAVRSLRRALWMPRGRLRMGGFADV